MPFFTKEDLLYPYRWGRHAEGDIFERDHGETVLSFINSFGNSEGAEVKGVGHKIERLLHQHLPEDITELPAIHSWIVRNWRSY